MSYILEWSKAITLFNYLAIRIKDILIKNSTKKEMSKKSAFFVLSNFKVSRF